MTDFEKLIDAAKAGSIEDAQALLQLHPELIRDRDKSGATALHYAAFAGHRDLVRLLVQNGADINARDDKFGATPAGWAIEYLRELKGFLGIELEDFAHAIRRGDVDWAARFLKRFPALRQAADRDGTPFKTLANQSGSPAMARLFDS